MSASRNDPKTHPASKRTAQRNNTSPPLPSSPSFEVQWGGTHALTSASNDTDNREPSGTLSLPSANSRLFGTRIPRLQNRYTLPRVERSDGSEPLSRELLQLPSSPSVTSTRSESDDSDIYEILDRYTTQVPSPRPTFFQHQGTATSPAARTFHRSTPIPQLDSSPLPILRGLQRVVEGQDASFLIPAHGSSSSPLIHKKYSSVSSLRSSYGIGHPGIFSTPSSHPFLRHKRSSTMPLDEWVEAGTPLPETPSQQLQSSPLRDQQHQRTNSTPVSGKLTAVQANPGPKSSANDSSSDHGSRSKPTTVLSSTITLAVHGPINIPPIDISDLRRPSSSMSTSISSGFSFVEPSSSPEPAIDSLARAEGRRSADQEMKEIEEENFRHSVSATVLDAVNHTNVDEQDSDFSMARLECSCDTAQSSHFDRSSSYKNTRSELPVQSPAALVFAGPFEIFSCTPILPGTQAAHDKPEMVPVQPLVSVDHGPSLAVTTLVVDMQLARPLSKLSITVPKTNFERCPVVPAEAEAQGNAAESSRPSTPVEEILCRGLTPLAIILIISAWILCALMRSIVRSTATAEPVQVSCVVTDLLISTVLAVSTCVGFHLFLGGRVEAVGIILRRNVEQPVQEECRRTIDRFGHGRLS